jgi:hypothetical protein
MENIPVQSVQLIYSREKAISFPQGNLVLCYCHNCSFIFNSSFDQNLLDYSLDYESTQSFSSTFNRFHEQLATKLIDKFKLENKNITEIGCGQGEFLELICRGGLNKGAGFDPALRSETLKNKPDFIEYTPDYFSNQNIGHKCDFLICKMTLEHIQYTKLFVQMIYDTIKKGTRVFFQVPSVERIISDLAFEDIYYEHCSYFTRDSLTFLFSKAGFTDIEVWLEYDDQYLMLTAQKGDYHDNDVVVIENGWLEKILKFEQRTNKVLEEWKIKITKHLDASEKVVLWGSGSKAVSFLNLCGLHREIEFVVDINTLRQGTYLAGTGQKIVSPKFLVDYQPDVVVVMNKIYTEEIKAKLSGYHLHPEIATL